jgi:protein-S-isoprenylcysteine O-methyltransferase Ste14
LALMVLLKSLFLFLIVALTAFVALPLLVLFFSNGFLAFQIGFYRFLGLIPLVVGAFLAFWTALSFALIGKGTPAPFDPTKNLVTIGLFNYVRNPMYLGAVLVMIGEGFLLQSSVIFLLAMTMWVFFHVFVIYYEEPDLKKRFGKEYEEYLCEVLRWLPRVFNRRLNEP